MTGRHTPVPFLVLPQKALSRKWSRRALYAKSRVSPLAYPPPPPTLPSGARILGYELGLYICMLSTHWFQKGHADTQDWAGCSTASCTKPTNPHVAVMPESRPRPQHEIGSLKLASRSETIVSDIRLESFAPPELISPSPPPYY